MLSPTVSSLICLHGTSESRRIWSISYSIPARNGSPALFYCSLVTARKTSLKGLLPKVSQETLAEMIGTTRSRVNFFMNKFRKLGFIQYNNGGLQVHTSLLSVVLHE